MVVEGLTSVSNSEAARRSGAVGKAFVSEVGGFGNGKCITPVVGSEVRGRFYAQGRNGIRLCGPKFVFHCFNKKVCPQIH